MAVQPLSGDRLLAAPDQLPNWVNGLQLAMITFMEHL
jgi:hypothetical protein